MALQEWKFDTAHSTIGFTVRHLVITKVHGRFTKWSGTLMVDEEKPQNTTVEVRIDPNSIDTSDANRDTHLRSADFFEVEKHPEMVFKSTKVERVDDTNFKLTGDLTIHSVTRPVTLDVEYHGRANHWGERAGFSAHTAISRKDFGMTFNQIMETGGVAVGDKVEINIDIEAIVAAPATA